MLIKTLRMENFRQFRGTTKVDFSCDPEKNVTIILGDNIRPYVSARMRASDAAE